MIRRLDLGGVMARPSLYRGVPMRFRMYDLPFLRWLAWIGCTAEAETVGILLSAALPGARVFAAGAFTLAGSATRPHGSRLLDNLWHHLTHG